MESTPSHIFDECLVLQIGLSLVQSLRIKGIKYCSNIFYGFLNELSIFLVILSCPSVF